MMRLIKITVLEVNKTFGCALRVKCTMILVARGVGRSTDERIINVLVRYT